MLRINLEVMNGNARARSLYERLGYRSHSRQPLSRRLS